MIAVIGITESMSSTFSSAENQCFRVSSSDFSLDSILGMLEWENRNISIKPQIKGI